MTYGFKSRHPHQMEKNRDFFREDLGFFFRFGYFYEKDDLSKKKRKLIDF